MKLSQASLFTCILSGRKYVIMRKTPLQKLNISVKSLLFAADWSTNLQLASMIISVESRDQSSRIISYLWHCTYPLWVNTFSIETNEKGVPTERVDQQSPQVFMRLDSTQFSENGNAGKVDINAQHGGKATSVYLLRVFQQSTITQ